MNRTQEHPKTDDFKAVSKHLESAYYELDQLFHDYVSGHPSLDRKVMQVEKLSRKLFEGVSEEYVNARIHTYFSLLVAGDAGLLNTIAKRYGQQLSPEALELIGHLQSEPMFWSLFRIEEAYDQAVFRIIDLLTGREMVLWSQALELLQNEQISRDAVYHCQLYSNGTCMQTAGPVLYSRSCLAEDFSFALTILNRDSHYASEPADIQQAFKNSYVSFHLIDRLAHMPVITTRGIALRYHWSIHKLPDGLAVQLPASGEFVRGSASGSLVSWIPVDGADWVLKNAERVVPDPAGFTSGEGLQAAPLLLEPRCIIDKKKGLLLIDAFTMVGYELVREKLEDLVPLEAADRFIGAFMPEEEENGCWYNDADSVGMHVRTLYQDELSHIRAPWQQFTDAIYKEDLKTRSPLEMNIPSYKEVLASFTKAYNNQDEPDPDMEPDDDEPDDDGVSLIQNLYENMLEVLAPPEEIRELARKHPLEGLGEIPFGVRLQMISLLENSSLFQLPDDSGLSEIQNLTRELSSSEFRGQLELLDYGLAIEEQFFSYFHDVNTAIPVMNMLIYGLLFCRGRWLEVRALAVCILLNYHSVLLQSYDDSKKFIEDLSIFIVRKLVPAGLCEVKARPRGQQRSEGTYEVRSTLLLEKLIRLT